MLHKVCKRLLIIPIFILIIFLSMYLTNSQTVDTKNLNDELSKTNPDNKILNDLWNELPQKERKNFWIMFSDEQKKKLLEAFDSDENRGKKYLELLDSLEQYYIVADSSKLDEYKRNDKNELLKLLNNKQLETLLSEATGKKATISESIEGKDVSYQAFYNRKFGSKYDTFQIKDPKGKLHTLSRKESLPENLEKIELRESKEIPGLYNMRYFDREDKNRVFLESGYYLKTTGKESEWLVESSDLTKRMTIGLDKKSGQIEIDEKGKIQMWGTPSLTGDEGMYVKIGDKKFFPHPDGPITEDKKYNYAFVNQLEDDVFNVKGNIQTKQIGMYIHDTDEAIVSFKDESKISGNVKSKIKDENLITVSESEGELSRLDISGNFKGKLSFAVSDDTKLIMSNSEFKIENKNGENYYTYLVEGGDVKRGLTDYDKGNVVGRLENLEFVSRQKEVDHDLKGKPRVGSGEKAPDPKPPPADEGEQTESTEKSVKSEKESDESEKESTEQKTSEQDTPARISEEAKKVIDDANKRDAANKVKEDNNFEVSTKDTRTTNTRNQQVDYGTFERTIKGYTSSKNKGYFSSSLGKFEIKSGRYKGNYNIEYTTIEKLKEISAKSTTVTITEPSWCGICATEISEGRAIGPFITYSQAVEMGFKGKYAVPQKVIVIDGKIR